KEKGPSTGPPASPGFRRVRLGSPRPRNPPTSEPSPFSQGPCRSVTVDLTHYRIAPQGCLAPHWGRFGGALGNFLQRLPADALAGAVAAEPKQAVQLMAIEALDRIVEALLRVTLARAGERVVDLLWPAFLLEGLQDALLVRGGPPEVLDGQVAPVERASFPVPAGQERPGVGSGREGEARRGRDRAVSRVVTEELLAGPCQHKASMFRQLKRFRGVEAATSVPAARFFCRLHGPPR